MTEWFWVVMLLTAGSIGMAVWMAVSAWQERGKPNRRRTCSEICTSVRCDCVAIEDR